MSKLDRLIEKSIILHGITEITTQISPYRKFMTWKFFVVDCDLDSTPWEVYYRGLFEAEYLGTLSPSYVKSLRTMLYGEDDRISQLSKELDKS